MYRVAVVTFMALLLVGSDDCKPKQAVVQAVYTRGSQARTITTPPDTDNRGFAFNLAPGEEIDRIKLSGQKILVGYSEPPNAPQLFEHEPTHKAQAGLDDLEGPTSAPFQLVLETNSSTPINVVEDLGPRVGGVDGNDWRPFHFEYARIEDIGECSGWLPTKLFYRQLRDRYEEQLGERYGTQRSPEGEDFVGWLDFVTGLHPPDPYVGPWVFYDYNPTNLGDGWIDFDPNLPWGGQYPPNTHYGEKGELALRFRFRMDGDVEWKPDPDWLPGKPGLSRFLSGAATAAIGASGFFPLLFLGDCSKDRHALALMRGQFEAAPDGGIGVRFFDRPTSWIGIQEWPARPICNNSVKPRFEEEFITNAIVLTQKDGEVISQTTTEDMQGSSLPWRRSDLSPIPVKRVVVTEKHIHGVFCETKTDCPTDLYQELNGRGLCNLDRDFFDAGEPYIVTTMGGL